MFKLFKQKMFVSLLLAMTMINLLLSGCGGCQVNNSIEPAKDSSAFINNIPYGGQIDGFVIASCGKCNLGQYGYKKCNMSIRIGQMVYEIVSYEHDHSKAHENDGICNALRIAHVSGEVKSGKFYADQFQLIDNPNK